MPHVKRFHFTKPMMTPTSFAVCMVWVNARGEKLSIAGDNSHVAEHKTVRHSYAVFTDAGETLKEDTSIFGTDELLRVIAEHMGFTVQSK